MAFWSYDERINGTISHLDSAPSRKRTYVGRSDSVLRRGRQASRRLARHTSLSNGGGRFVLPTRPGLIFAAWSACWGTRVRKSN